MALPVVMEALALAVESTVRAVGGVRHISPGLPNPVAEAIDHGDGSGGSFALVYPSGALAGVVGDRIPMDEVFPGVQIECRSGGTKVAVMALEVDAELEMSCGLRSLFALAREIGRPLDAAEAAELGRKYPQSVLSMLDVEAAATAVRVELDGVRGGLDELLELKCPAIIHFKTGHFVVLVGPRVGEETMVIDEGRPLRVTLQWLRDQSSGAALVPAGCAP
ncbi:MAG: hypothetical protein FJX74_15575 [Armatimonadetes bacterium]|nr:hypothetical protein [Armatimonadota bacterium]